LNDTDKLIQEEFFPFYKRVLEAFKSNHPKLFTVLDLFLSGKKNNIGLRITENGTAVRDYTIYLEGVGLSHIENGVLAPEVKTPFGVIRPYTILEKNTLQKMINDEPDFVKDPFTTKMKYADEFTVKFLKCAPLYDRLPVQDVVGFTAYR
jgi:hypothetical protein